MTNNSHSSLTHLASFLFFSIFFSAQQATDSGVSEEEVIESLQERLKRAAEEKSEEAEEILSSPTKTAVVGKLTDIANETLTIETREEAEELVASNEDTTFVRGGKTVKLQDIQIDDFVIAMGYRNGNEVLEAKRVVATTKPQDRPQRTILLATVAEINIKNKTLTVTDTKPVELGGTDTYTIIVPKSSDFDFDELEENTKLIITALPDKNDEFSLTLRTYKIISSSDS
jgi:hypothetical protein